VPLRPTVARARDAQGGGRRRLDTLKHDVRSMAASAAGVVLVARVEDGHALVEISWAGKRRALARFSAPSRGEVASIDTGVYVGVGHDILFVARVHEEPKSSS
jgi:hypothetical protein